MVWPQNDGSADKLDNKHFENFLVEYIAAAEEVPSIMAKFETAKNMNFSNVKMLCHLM